MQETSELEEVDGERAAPLILAGLALGIGVDVLGGCSVRFHLEGGVLLAGVLLCRLFRETWGDQVNGTCCCGSLSTTGASSCSHRLGRGVLLCDLCLPCDALLQDGPGSASSSSWSSTEFHIDPLEVGLRLLVMEFRMKSRIRRGDGSSLKAAFFTNTSGLVLSYAALNLRRLSTF